MRAPLNPEAWKALRTIVVGLLVGAALTVLVLAAVCCSHAPAGPGRIILPERLGSIAAETIGALVGQEPKAATIPGGPTIVFQPADAGDTCLWAHEQVHREQQAEMGPGPWSEAYARQLAACERGNDRGTCLRTIPLEAKAYEAQHECQAMRGGR